MNRRDMLQALSVGILSGKFLSASPFKGGSAGSFSSAQASHTILSKKTFLFGSATRNLDEFRALAQSASRLKPYGDVQIDISVLADKSWYEMPAINSPWHEYACEMQCMAKVFPHPKIAPFIPADWVAKNRELLLAKAKILRQLGMNATFHSDETHYLPAAFFEKYPHLRGPRIDHPRRSNQQEFTWCVDLEETREMITWMAAELKRNVPEIKTIISHNNDAGGGLCWSAALYSGPNGPAHCANRDVGIRVKEYAEAIHRGAQKAGGDFVIRMDGNFWQNEDLIVRRMLPPNTFLDSGEDPAETSGESPLGYHMIGVGSFINTANPIKGLIDPIAILSTLDGVETPDTETIVINISPWYSRGDDSVQTAERLIEMVQDCLEEPYHGLLSQIDKLRKLAKRWGGAENTGALVEAFYAMNQAFLLKGAIAPGFSNTYCEVSMRYITRPLLFKPDVLKPEEERSFLPFVFNVSEVEARNDYADLHGMRMKGPNSWDDAGLQRAIGRALHAAQVLENTKGAPEQKWLQQLAISLRLWVNALRSMNNFYFGQLLRDRNAAAIMKGPHVHPKQFTMTGDGDYLDWNNIQRDELDNTTELIALLEKGGLELLVHADHKRYEDTFLLGPDLIEALHEKVHLMEREWQDAQQYLASPLK